MLLVALVSSVGGEASVTVTSEFMWGNWTESVSNQPVTQ